MTSQPDTVRQSDLLNQQVIDRTTMEEIGRVEVLWFYPPAHKVLGFVCKSGLLGAKKFAFNLGQVHTLGASLLVNSGAQETDGDKVSQLESLIGCEVWSDGGERIGKVIDCVFHLKTGAIRDYLVSPGGLAIVTEGVYRLPPSKILSTGRRRVLITEATARSLEPFRTGIKGRLNKVTDSLKQEYTGATDGLRSLTQRAQSATEQAKDRARRLADQARERAEQLREDSQSLTQQARDRGQDFVEQVKERSQTISEQVKGNTQSWTAQVQEQFDAVLEELGSPGLDDRNDDRDQNPDEAEFAPLDEEDLLSGDWGIPVAPRATGANPDRAAAPAQVIPAAVPATVTEMTPAYVLDPPPAISLDDDFWDEPITPNLIDSPAIEVPASPVSEPEVTESGVAESKTADPKPAVSIEKTVFSSEIDDEPWI